MAMARIHPRHRDSLCAICLGLTYSELTLLSVAKRLRPSHTIERSTANFKSQFLT